MTSQRAPKLWAEFETGPLALTAARALRAKGYDKLAAFTPYPMPELEEALGLPRPRLLLALVLVAACSGATIAFLLMWWTAARSYPLNVGGRPLNSFVTDIPIMFETAVLAAAVTAFFGVLVSSGMPRLNHPLDAVPGFERTSLDRFWIGVAGSTFAEGGVSNDLRELLAGLGALHVREEPRDRG